MINIILRTLSWGGFGLSFAVFVIMLGVATALGAGQGPVAVFGLAVILVGAGLALCALRYVVGRVRARSKHKAPGKRVDVGGYFIHVLAEGPEGRGPSVVWLPGAHAGGVGLHPLHRILREQARSILVDRPGTGWSDVGPFPRRSAREARELLAALEGAGEKGPFILAGHSFGGLLAAHMARQAPDRTAAVVLMDATPLDVVALGPPMETMWRMSGDMIATAIRRQFGFESDPARGLKGAEAARVRALIRETEERLGPEGRAGMDIERSAGAACAAASAYQELNRYALARSVWGALIYDGDLDGIRTIVMTPGDIGAERESILEITRPDPDEDPGSETARRLRFFERSRERWMAVSDRAERLTPPAGSSHNFPFEHPQFVIDAVKDEIRRHGSAA